MPGSEETTERKLAFSVRNEPVSALLLAPGQPRALYVYAHGAGAPMQHAFMQATAHALAARGVATFRYNFPYMEYRRGRPDRAPVLLDTVRAAVDAASAALPDVPLVAGGKSMGGRMTSQAQAAQPLPGVRSLAFVGFPLHPPKRPAIERAEHLSRVRVPMLFLQGTRDDLADLDLIRSVVSGLGPVATLHVVEGADHGFHVLKRSGRTDSDVLEEVADALAAWAGVL